MLTFAGLNCSASSGTASGSGGNNAWVNDDIRPLLPSRRRWAGSTCLGWWAIWMMGLSNFQIGSSLVAVGLSIWQTMIAAILGDT
ncbi:hypothetical protein BDW68DRAFT_174851 [Aspergillus falconensis]